MANMKKPAPKRLTGPSAPSTKKSVRVPAVKKSNQPPTQRRLLPKDMNAAPSPRRLLANSALAASAPKRVTTAAKKAAANPKVAKRAPLETKRIGGVFAIPVKPKKTIY
jgi:hypothetical protein